jgi:hypothetical protein
MILIASCPIHEEHLEMRLSRFDRQHRRGNQQHRQRELQLHFGQFTTSAKKMPANRFDAERTATGVPAENFQSRAGNEIVMMWKQIKNPPLRF